MGVNIDPDTTPDTYIEHRELVRIGAAGSTEPARPTRIRIGSSTGAAIEADVNVWLGGGLPPMRAGFLKDFTTRYLDPTEVYAKLGDLAAEFPNISQLDHAAEPDERLPTQGAGDHERAPALRGARLRLLSRARPSCSPRVPGAMRAGTTSRPSSVNPGVASSPLSVTVSGNDIVVSLATDAAGALVEHGCAGRCGDQRQPRGERARSSPRRSAGTSAWGSSSRVRRSTCPTS